MQLLTDPKEKKRGSTTEEAIITSRMLFFGEGCKYDNVCIARGHHEDRRVWEWEKKRFGARVTRPTVIKMIKKKKKKKKMERCEKDIKLLHRNFLSAIESLEDTISTNKLTHRPRKKRTVCNLYALSDHVLFPIEDFPFLPSFFWLPFPEDEGC